MYTLLNQKKRRYIASVRRLLQETYGISDAGMAEQNRIWATWAEHVDYAERRLVAFWKDSENIDSFRARALAILMAHHVRWAPFAWKDDDTDSYVWYFIHQDDFKLTSLRGQEREFAVGLLRLNLPNASRKVRGTYNELIRHALMFMEEPQGRELLRYYQLNDAEAFSRSGNVVSGYNPFERLLDSQVPWSYKKQADYWMREIVTDELAGKRKPRAPWEDAYRCYARILCAVGRAEDYPLEYLKAQVEFVLKLAIVRPPPFDADDYGTLLYRFAAKEHADVRRHLAYGIAKSYPDGIPASLQAWTKELLEEFGPDDLGTRVLLGAAASRPAPIPEPPQPRVDREAEVLALMRK